MAARSRLLLARSLMSAVRSATRPGAPSMAERAGSVPRLVRAVAAGDYRGMTVGRLGMLAVAAAYVISPVDLLPEGFLAVFGLADDAMVLSWLAANLVTETEEFLEWERAGTPGSNATAADPQDAATSAYAGAGATVSGRVVR